MQIPRVFLTVIIQFASALAGLSGRAQIIFADDFSSGASPQWSNLRGNWTVSGGAYYATAPNNNPATFSGLTNVLTNFSIDVDINLVADGGIWLRSDASGTNGVLLVTGGHGWGGGARGGNAGRSLYWHVITSANYNNPPILSEAFNVFSNPGVESVHLRVEVNGNLYSAFLNGSTNAVTSLVETNNTYAAGHVGLYDFSSQTFDNFVLQIPPGFGSYSLNISHTAPDQAQLFWTTNALGWDLEAATSLAPAVWNPITNAPVTSGTNFTVTISVTNNQSFFRLRKP